MKNRFILCLAMLQTLLAVSLFALAPDRNLSADSLAARVDSLIIRQNPLFKPGGPGCAIAVIRDGKIVFERGYGLANLDWAIPNSPTTVFQIASMSKQFTAACIVLLAEDGKLSLEDDIRTWLPETRDYGKKITIRNLLNHTSGIRDYESLMVSAGMRYDLAWEPREIFDFIVRQSALDFVPGEKFSYSNSGYILLAEIVHRATSLTLGQFAEQRIFKPLGMKNTLYYETLYQVVKNRATGYDRDFDRMIYTAGQSDTYTLGPAGVFTTVEDLALWDRNFYENRIGGPHFIETMLSRPVLTGGDTSNYACGLEYDIYRGLPTLSHSGWWAGYLSYMMRFPEQRTTIILLANSTSDIGPSVNCYKIADLYLYDQFPMDKRPAPEEKAATSAVHAEVAVDPAIYDQYAGRYQIGNLDMVATIARDGKRLMGQFTGQFRFQLFPESDSTFFLKIDEVQVKFRRDETGRVNTLLWYQRGREVPVNRIVSRLTGEELSQYCGDYRSEDLKTTWSITPEEGWLKVRSSLRTIDLTGEDLAFQKQGDLFCLSNMSLQFLRDGKGRISGFELTHQGCTWKVNFTRR